MKFNSAEYILRAYIEKLNLPLEPIQTVGTTYAFCVTDTGALIVRLKSKNLGTIVRTVILLPSAIEQATTIATFAIINGKLTFNHLD